MMAILWPERHRLESFMRFDPDAIMGVTTSLTLHLMGAVVAMLAVVAIADYFFQYRQWYERQKMSLQEMKEEFKQSEGDPHIKGRIRQLRQARMKKRMMAAVPKASVIITNPTHYAVALSYERGMSAPICVAKGTDLIALKIREVAGQHDIPIVENVPLARACMPPWRSTTKSRWNTTMRSPRSSATSWASSAGFPAGGRDLGKPGEICWKSMQRAK